MLDESNGYCRCANFYIHMKHFYTPHTMFRLFILIIFIASVISTDASSSLASVPKTRRSEKPSPAKPKKITNKVFKPNSSSPKPQWLLNPMPPISATSLTCEVSLLSVIERARTLLRNEHVSYTPWAPGRREKREVKLALANLKTGSIHIASGWMSGDNLFLYNKNIQFDVEWMNGFNSAINIINPDNTAVVAILYAIEPSRQKIYGTSAILYTPFSSALLQPELVQAGKQYLLKQIAAAQNELHHVASQAFPGRSLKRSPAFSAEDYLHIILAEQMDPGRFYAILGDNPRLGKRQQGNFKQLADRILVIVGANQETAYRFTGSPAGAHGLTQFTPVGMRTVWENYPDSGIPQNFFKATSHHDSAIKAKICLLDHYLAQLASAYPRLRGSRYEKYAAAAAYNGGPKRVLDGLKQFGMLWLNPRERLAYLSGKQNRTRREQREYQWLKNNQYHETFVYLMKLHALDQASLYNTDKKIPVQAVQNVVEGNAIARD